MKTFAFYSYKGGVGRSLLLANAARFLATLGKGVVALDLDLEAPGLHYKLAGRKRGKSKRRDSRAGGAVPYLVATARGAISPPPLKNHLIEVPVPPQAGGWLKLMPAGPAPDRAYWSALKELGNRLRLDDPSGEALMAVLDLQARIEEELNPDYLLIDARTGVTELGGLATTILADTVVCMFVANQESLDGTLTVVEALKAAPRLNGQGPIRVVPLLSRLISKEPSSDDRFSSGVRRLLELGEGKKTPRQAGGSEQAAKELHFLPHDAALGAAERIVGGESIASAFSPLYKAYLELFQALFPSGADDARRALERLEAVAAVEEELISDPRQPFGFERRLRPWPSSAITDGVALEVGWGEPRSRYADLVCRSEAGRPLMVVEYIAESSEVDATEFWKRSDVRCVVLLDRKKLRGVERRILARDRGGTLRRIDRWELPLPAEFELFPDLGDRSIGSMLDALRQSRPEAVAWLIDEWRQSMGGFTGRREPAWRPERARRILDGLAAIEDVRTAEEILRRSSEEWPVLSPLAHRHKMIEFSIEDLDRRLDEDLFGPLFWRLPVEAVKEAMEPKRYPGETLSLAGYRLLASDLLGLDYDPYETALAEGQSLAQRFAPRPERTDEGEEWLPIHWLHRNQRNLSEQLQLSSEAPPALVWEALLGEKPYWRGTLGEARKTLGEKESLITSTAGLRRRLRAIADRHELATQGLLGEYGADGRIELYPAVIEAAAELLSLPPRYLKSVVFIHLSTRALAHQARDLDDQPGYGFAPTPQTRPFEQESPVHVNLVQVFTHRLIRRLQDANLLAAFEKLSQYQPQPYRQWIGMQNTPLETLRGFLLKARGSASAVGLPDPGWGE